MGIEGPFEETGVGPGGTGVPQTPEDGAWQPPTAVEERLYAAGWAADWPVFHATLAGTDLFFPVSRELVDALSGGVRLRPFRDPQVDGLCLAVFTRGMVPSPGGDLVFERGDLAALARVWPRAVRWLAVNPGTPVETFLPADIRLWKRHARRADAEQRLKTLRTGQRTGPLAHGMACGAMLLVEHGSPWNHLGWQGHGYTEARELLKAWWAVAGRDDWLAIQRRLLRGEVVRPAWEFVLRVRHALTQADGGDPGAVVWREAAERVLVSRTAEVVDQTGQPPAFDLDADLALVQELIGHILRYEARFRADGVLPQDRCVRSVLAWDFSRASGMARWGLGARYCEIAETERAVLQVGAASREVYRSWADFAAGYLLGRCLHLRQLGGAEFGDWYPDMLAVHRLLSTEQESPWLTVPWEQPDPEPGPAAGDLTDR